MFGNNQNEQRVINTVVAQYGFIGFVSMDRAKRNKEVLTAAQELGIELKADRKVKILADEYLLSVALDELRFKPADKSSKSSWAGLELHRQVPASVEPWALWSVIVTDSAVSLVKGVHKVNCEGYLQCLEKIDSCNIVFSEEYDEYDDIDDLDD